MVRQANYYCSINGCSNSNLNIADRGLAYGDGLFETMRLHNGKIILLERHLRRLSLGCQRLFIPYDEQKIRKYLKSLLLSAENSSRHYGILKLIVTRGQGGVGYEPPEYDQTEPSIILQLSLKPVDFFNTSPFVSLHPCVQTLSSSPILAGIKHTNRLEYILAARELAATPEKQGLLLDKNGCVIETLHHNLFLVKEGQLLTPKLTYCGVEGVMKGLIMEVLAHALIPSMTILEVELTMDDVLEAEEVFLSNSVRGVVGVSSINDRQWRKHPVTQQLNTQLNNVWSDINGGR